MPPQRPAWTGRHLPAALLTAGTLFAAWLNPAAALASDLVVDRDSLGGPCSDTRPLERVSAALPLCGLEVAARAAPAGATVVVRRGTYPGLRVKGVVGRPGMITFRPASNEHPTIGGLRTEDTSDLRFVGMRITGPVLLSRGSRRIQLIRNDISPRGVTVRAPSEKLVFERNRIHHLDYRPGELNSGYGLLLAGWGGGIRDVVVRENRIDRIPVDGIQVTSVTDLSIEGNEITGVRKPPGSTAHSDSIQLLGGSRIAIRSNFVHDNVHGLINTDVAVQDLALVNNAFVRIANFGTVLHRTSNSRIVNNTYWNTGYGLGLRDNTTGMTVLNNVLDHFESGRQRLALEDHNLIADGSRYGAHDIALPPRFVAPQRLDFRLASDSPAINAGVSSGAPRADRFGRARRGLPDLGAVEHVGSRGFGLRLLGPKTQRFEGRRGLLVKLTSPVSCKVAVTARLRLPERLVATKTRRLRLEAGEPVMIRLRPTSRRSLAAIRLALRKRRALKASVRAAGKDAAGDSLTVHRAIRLSKPPG